MNPSHPSPPSDCPHSDQPTAPNVPALPVPEPIHKSTPIQEQPPASQNRVEHVVHYDDQMPPPPKEIVAIPREPAVPILVESPAPEPITKSAHVPKMRHDRKFPVDRNQGFKNTVQHPMNNSARLLAIFKVLLIFLSLIVLLPLALKIFFFVICTIIGGGSNSGH